MPLKERVYSVLIVTRTEKFSISLTALLSPSKFSPVKTVTCVSEAKRALLERDYDLVMINSPLEEENGSKLAVDICTGKNSCALVFVPREQYLSMSEEIRQFGVFTLPKPTSAQMASQAIDWMCATRERLARYEKTVSTVKQKMEEIRTVNHAKWILIDVLKMTEEDAHRYIEKQAMDRCVSRMEIAKNIIATYK